MNNLISLFLVFFPLLVITLIASFRMILWLFYDEIESIIKISVKDIIREAISESYNIHDYKWWTTEKDAVDWYINECDSTYIRGRYPTLEKYLNLFCISV